MKVSQVVAFGIGCGGPLDSKRGVIVSPPNLPGWDDVPIVAPVRRAFRCENRCQNDAEMPVRWPNGSSGRGAGRRI
ncbi:MAG: ROK family protein [Alistipes indistinctus]